jgi:hypothetical protein
MCDQEWNGRRCLQVEYDRELIKCFRLRDKGEKEKRSQIDLSLTPFPCLPCLLTGRRQAGLLTS